MAWYLKRVLQVEQLPCKSFNKTSGYHEPNWKTGWLLCKRFWCIHSQSFAVWTFMCKNFSLRKFLVKSWPWRLFIRWWPTLLRRGWYWNCFGGRLVCMSLGARTFTQKIDGDLAVEFPVLLQCWWCFVKCPLDVFLAIIYKIESYLV